MDNRTIQTMNTGNQQTADLLGINHDEREHVQNAHKCIERKKRTVSSRIEIEEEKFCDYM